MAVLALVVPWLARPGSPAAAAGVQQVSSTAYQVVMAHYSFGPASLTVTAGDTVTWTNTDQAAHDVTTASAPASFHSPLLAKGQSWSVVLTVPGTYSYYCSVHPDMRARVVVQPAPVAPTRPPVTAAPSHSHGGSAATRPPTARPPVTHPPQPPAQGGTPTTPAPAGAANAGSTGSGSSLNPLLLVAGVVTAVAAFCLLLLATAPRRRG
ncbi:MAG TPA: plastocyanin/azurin family copper-binding protein [Mycobacteriales bacterium]|nr:plastocyanin/azurin family copper-binding protein [Mycobacteriales bacterium]